MEKKYLCHQERKGLSNLKRLVDLMDNFFHLSVSGLKGMILNRIARGFGAYMTSIPLLGPIVYYKWIVRRFRETTEALCGWRRRCRGMI